MTRTFRFLSAAAAFGAALATFAAPANASASPALQAWYTHTGAPIVTAIEQAATKLDSHDLHTVEGGCYGLSIAASRALKAPAPPAATFAFHWAASMSDYHSGATLCLKAFADAVSPSAAVASQAKGLLVAGELQIEAGVTQMEDATKSI